MTGTAQRYKRIASIAAPMVATMSMVSIAGLVDTALISPFGADAVSAVGLSNFIFISIFTMMSGLNAATQALTSRVVGRGDEHLSRAVLGSSLSIAAVLGLLGFGLISLADQWLLSRLAADSSVTAIGLEYTHLRRYALLFQPAMQCFMGYRMGRGESRVILRVSLTLQLFNVLASYALIYGKLGLPEMGVAGSGLGTSMALLLGFSIHLHTAKPRFAAAEISRMLVIRKLLSVGVGASLSDFVMTLGWTAALALAGLLGSAAQAASAVSMQLLMLGSLMFHGMGASAGTLAGWSLAKKDIAGARQWMIMACHLAMLMALPLVLSMAFFGNNILSLFVKDPAVVVAASPVVLLVSFSLLFDAIGNVLRGAISSVGAPLSTLSATLAPMWLIFVPGSWFVGVYLDMGLTAFWSTYLVFRLFSMLGLMLVWRRGHWAFALGKH